MGKNNRYTVINRVILGKFDKRNEFTNLLNYIGSEIVDNYIADVEYTLIIIHF